MNSQQLAEELARFWKKVNKSGNIPQHMPHLGRCWQWIGGEYHIGKGYGGFWSGKRSVRAHRWIFQQINKGFDSKLLVCHHCDNRGCVRPSHLFQGSNLDNNLDAINKGRDRKSFGDNNASRKYPERRPRGSAHALSKLVEHQVVHIKQMLLNGQTKASLAREFGVSWEVINSISCGRSWKHVKLTTKLQQLGIEV